MKEWLYDINTGLIAGLLLLSMLVAMELGHLIGRRRSVSLKNEAKEHINDIQASVLGILALLLGFTFSLSLQRYDSRSDLVVEEANAIGTAYLRVQLLPEAMREDARQLLSNYVDLRVEESTLSLVQNAEREALMSRTSKLQSLLWTKAQKGVEADMNVYPPALFVESVNDLIDSYGKRNAALNRHVPEVVLVLLYCTFLMAGGIVGYATGVAEHRPSFASYLMVLLMVMLVFIILDLDRPRRGLIEVSQQPLVSLQSSIHQSIKGR
jgi:hypothetical protein